MLPVPSPAAERAARVLFPLAQLSGPRLSGHALTVPPPGRQNTRSCPSASDTDQLGTPPPDETRKQCCADACNSQKQPSRIDVVQQRGARDICRHVRPTERVASVGQSGRTVAVRNRNGQIASRVAEDASAARP
jgi:hypothetical protein